ncbi:MAG: methionyl-tRNA formyltransferase [Candidatus Hydrogenedentes bacterium]|nr:methionyl-tRNA formyltransferase [Candidatus Hydrogenedentota bacterium]
MRIALAGGGYLAASLANAVLESSHEIVAIVQDGRRSQGARRWILPWVSAVVQPRGDVRGIAKRKRIPLLYIDKMGEEELAPLRALEPDLILVGGFGVILKRPILDLPRIGCVNVHSSLLPKHRGANPFAAVIMAGESETGVTFHVMDEGIDTGDILEQYTLTVKPHYYAVDIHRKASDLAGDEVASVLDRIQAEGLNGVPQDSAQASYDQKPTADDALVDWTQPAEEIERRVRAFFPENVARFPYGNRLIYIHRARVEPDAADAADAAPGTVLQIRPRARIATGRGAIALTTAYCLEPFPWVWPGAFTRLKPGAQLG